MLRLLAISVGLLYSLCGWAQPAPVSFPVAYSYGAADGLPAGGNFSTMMALPDGSWLVQPWTRPMVRITNTGFKALHYDTSMQKAGIGSLRAVIGSSEWFAQEGWGLVRRRGDTLYTKPAYRHPEGGVVWACAVGNQLLCTSGQGAGSKLYRFDGQRWWRLSLPDPVFNQSDELAISIVRDEKVRLLAHNVAAGHQCKVFELQEKNWQLTEVAHFQLPAGAGPYKLLSADTLLMTYQGSFYKLANGQLQKQPLRYAVVGGEVLETSTDAGYASILTDGRQTSLTVGITDRLQGVQPQAGWPSYLLGTAGGLHRVFPYVRYYPRLYAGVHSQATHSLMQMANGQVYAGSYGGYLSAISPTAIVPIRGYKVPVMPGGTGFGNAIFFFAELAGSFWCVQPSGKLINFSPGNYLSGFFITPAANGKQLYAGMTSHHGIGVISVADALAGRSRWRFIDSSKGVALVNVLTIAQDPRGRLWFGRFSEGWGVYDTLLDKGVTYRIADGETKFGAMSSAVDSRGTVWLAGRHGLHYANGNKPTMPTPADVRQLQHPLLPDGADINSLKIWKNYLLIGAGKRLLLLDLIDFYQQQPAIAAGRRLARIRYLSPQELVLTAEIEQNALLTDHRDSSIWLATNNMVYQIDMAARLRLPDYKARPGIRLIAGTDTLHLQQGTPVSLAPTSNSLQIDVLYQTPDNLPRLTQLALQAEGDTIRWTAPGTDYHLNALNRQTGQYQLRIRIFEFDGSVNEFVFPIRIRKFLWQQWWFWLWLSLGLGSAIFYAYYLYKQKQLAEAHAARIAAEAEALKADQQRRLTTMQVKSLSNQFRPHFILNALNTVGAQLYDKPEVDEVLGQLGDSIGIIFKNAQQGSVAHPLAQEWQLVQSVINIKQLEYKQSVRVLDELSALLPQVGSWLVPMGILQIPVENALIHGLRNKEAGEKKLWLQASVADGALHISIADNGVGRRAAAAMSNYRSNGVGSKNLQAIIDLLNAHNPQKISYEIIDKDAAAGEGGMEVRICIPQFYNYDI